MSQAKIDEALWVQSLLAPLPAAVAARPADEPRRPSWFGLFRRRR